MNAHATDPANRLPWHVRSSMMRPMRSWLVAILCVVCASRADARTATGYQGGQKTKVKVVDVAGAEAEVATAKAFKTMAKAARKAGITLAIRSGFRTHAKQTKLYKKYRRGDGNLAARPGYSVHENGRALDLVVTSGKTRAWLEANASTYGFHRTVAGEPWHWEYIRGSEGSRDYGVERRVAVDDAPDTEASERDGDYDCTRDWRAGQLRP